MNYNAGTELGRALESIAAELAGQPWEAIVVDNASSDGSAALVADFAPEARLILNEENVGFARGVNQGLAAAAAPFILVMNPDCRLEPGALAALQDILRRHESCAIVGPRILNPDGSLQGSARGDPDMLTGIFGRAQSLRRIFPGLPVSRRNVVDDDAVPDADGSLAVDWVSGACILARRDALVGAGGFDERYFLYWEDADLCRRLRKAGCETRYVTVATAVHRAGHSSRTNGTASIRAFHASAYLYYATHVAPGRWHPKRLLARTLLAVRCRVHLYRSQHLLD